MTTRRNHVRPIDALILVGLLAAFGVLIADGHLRRQGLAAGDVAAFVLDHVYRFVGSLLYL